MSTNKCSNCQSLNLDCTYLESAKVRLVWPSQITLYIQQISETSPTQRVCADYVLTSLLNYHLDMSRVWKPV